MADNEEKLRYKLTADDSQAGQVLDRFRGKLEKAGGSDFLKGVGEKFESLSSEIPIEGVERFAGIFSATGPFAAGAVVIGALAAVTKNLVGEIDDLDIAAQGIGTTAVALSELRISAGQAGVNAEQLDKALAGLNIRAAEAASGNKEAAAGFARIGVSVRDAAGNLKPTEQLLGEISDKVRLFADDINKTSALADIFGQKLGPRLAAYLNQGSDGLRVASGLTQDMVEEATKAQKEIDKLGAAWARLKLSLGGRLAGLLNSSREIDEVADATRRLAQAQAELNARTSSGNEGFAKKADDFLTRLFGGDPDEQVKRAKEAVTSLENVISSASIGRFTSGRAAINAAENLKASLPDKEDAADLERNAQALASFVNGLQGTIDAAAGLTKTQEALRALATNAFGPAISGNQQVRQLLLGLAAAADKAIDEKRIQAQREAFAGYVSQLDQAITATEKLSHEEDAERAIAQERFGPLTSQQAELLRGLAKELDGREKIAKALEEQVKQHDALAKSLGVEKQFQDDLVRQLNDFAGITDEIRKIALTTKLEDILRNDGNAFTPEQLDKIVKGIAGISDESAKADDTLRELGLTFTSAFEDAAVGAKDFKDVLNGLVQDIFRIAIRKQLTEPLLNFFSTLKSGESTLQGFGGLLGSIFRGIGSAGGGASSADLEQLGVGLATTSSAGGLAKASSAGGTKAASGNVYHITQNIDMRGNGQDSASVRRATEGLRKQTLAAVQDARLRNPAAA